MKAMMEGEEEREEGQRDVCAYDSRLVRVE